jgi:hypothetical protein
MAVRTQGAVPGGLQIEYNDNTGQLVIQARNAQKFTAAGQLALLNTFNSYYAGLTTAQKNALPDFLLHITAGSITATVVNGTEPTLAANLTTAAAGLTVRG